ncbi:helix-turn-helix domain-containing protein [Alloalcanivorax sp. C16-2]|uniref:helix-turn-helix domain-containing protein n=1 Tax=Alloalcanivorax TaxID=3020832 RepID=UPI0019333A77|nr:helix-turn-helix domain-containing protein [Alloalcanivorax marinus]MBL7250225.1 helix-turn-helix domain-containing protein [Alloalcanivorax marinus]
MAKGILGAVHDTAHDLSKAGVMDAVTLREFDAMCLPEIRPFRAADIRRIRRRYKVSQAVFAAYLNTSLSTVQKWERGDKNPNGISLKLLNLVDSKGLEVLL